MSYPSKFVEFFGPATWKALHSMAFNYAKNPDKPTEAEKRDAVDFYRLVERMLPCESCRVHYGKYINANPIDASSRDALTRWLYDCHSAVNERNKKPNISYQEHVYDYSGWDQARTKHYSSLSPKARLKYLADPHLGRPVYTGKSESLIGEESPAAMLAMLVMAGIAGVVGFRVVSGRMQGSKEASKKE